ncbi:CHAT domain-containing tetratricopeptide repeat protein [Flavobacterium sp.]|uniref:CHAT domain-containing protein n=1 Tax=Flavobacterium sp. TaxID=239 RepID=UPI002B4B5011|nr:CHAT domain-containing tetratricopeptide repeat protein [Flavobacterium sp.]HLP63255.1 CHAT domain-containing tetratricopeptide repeat protein [Flavobacterium sp.]
MKKLWILILMLPIAFYGQNTSSQQLQKKADSLSKIRKFDESFLIWEQLQKNKNDKNFSLYSANYLYTKAMDEVEKGNYNQAIVYFKKALPFHSKIQPTSQNKKLISDTYLELSYCLDDWDEVLKYLNICYSYTLKNLPKDANVYRSLVDIGDVQRRTRNYEQSIVSLEKALKLIYKLAPKDYEELGYVHNLLAISYSDLHFHNQSLHHYTKSLELHIQSNRLDKAYVVNSANNTIWENLNYGDEAKARELVAFLNKNFYKWYRQKEFATTDVGTLKNWNLHFKSLLYLSNLRMNVLDKKESIAKKYLDSIVLVFDNYSEDRKKKDNTMLLSRYAYENVFLFKPIDDVPNSKNHIEFNLKTLQIARKSESKHDELVACLKLANAYTRYKKYTEALNVIEESKKIKEPFFNASRFTIEVLEATLRYNLNQNNESKLVFLKSYQKLLAKQRTLKNLKSLHYSDFKKFNSDVFIRNVLNTANIYFKSYQKSKSKDDLVTANNLYFIVSDMFSEFYQKGKYNYRLNEFNKEIASGLLQTQLLINPNDTKKIKAILNRIENNSSQHLWNIFESKNSQNLKVPASLIQEYNQLVFEKNALMHSGEIKKMSAIDQKKVIQIEQKIQQTTAAINKFDAAYQTFKSNSFDVEKVQNKLKKNQTMVKYVVTDLNVYAFVLNQDDIQLRYLCPTKTARTLTQNHLKNIRLIDQNYVQSATKLHETLLQPILEKHPTTSLIVIPEDFLNYISFESLQNKKGQWLIKNYLVSYAYSMKLWDILQEKRISTSSNQFVSFAPNYDKIPSAQQNRGLRRGNLFDLKEAKNEAKVISNLFKGQLFLNEQATKSNFLQSTTSYNFHHLAMHSLMEDNYNESSLVFTNNQKVYFNELYQLNFPSKMVVLSACNTGVGEHENGEGIMSLSRALTYAGVKSSVYSLWQVPDKETSEIMIAFYENLKDGQSKDEALANAKRTFLEKNPMKNHPFYWAGFVVNGDVRPIDEGISIFVYLGIALLIGSAVFLLRKKLF